VRAGCPGSRRVSRPGSARSVTGLVCLWSLRRATTTSTLLVCLRILNPGMAETICTPSSSGLQLLQPVDFDFLGKRLKFWVAGHEFRLLFLGQRGGESIGQTHLETCLEIGGSVGQSAGCGMKI